MRSWKIDIEKLHEKWPDEEKFEKKYEEFRCKEVKNILFDPYIKSGYKIFAVINYLVLLCLVFYAL